MPYVLGLHSLLVLCDAPLLLLLLTMLRRLFRAVHQCCQYYLHCNLILLKQHKTSLAALTLHPFGRQRRAWSAPGKTAVRIPQKSGPSLNSEVASSRV